MKNPLALFAFLALAVTGCTEGSDCDALGAATAAQEFASRNGCKGCIVIEHNAYDPTLVRQDGHIFKVTGWMFIPVGSNSQYQLSYTVVMECRKYNWTQSSIEFY